MGPVTFFDKSFLQAINVDEAAIFSFLYKCHLTPIFFAEVLSDIEKQHKSGRSPESIVGGLAHKTAALGRNINVSHNTLCVGNLLGQDVQMRRVPVIGNARPTVSGNRKGFFGHVSPEATAMERWENGQFLELERDIAQNWRQALEGLQLSSVAQSVRETLGDRKPRDMSDALKLAEEICENKPGHIGPVKLARDLFVGNDRPDIDRQIMTRWKDSGRPSLERFAPYAGFCTKIEVFFHICLASDIIAWQRPSNRVDIAYLFYLPFSMVFVSSDKLHRSAAPFFLGNGQQFIWGQDLKADLSRIVEYFSSLPADEQAKGLFHIARTPPPEIEGVTLRLWKELLGHDPSRTDSPVTPESGSGPKFSQIMERVESMKSSDRRHDSPIEEVEDVVMEHRVPRKMGRWTVIPDHVVEDAEKNDRGD